MAIDITTFRTRYPELTATKLPDAQVTVFLEDGQCDFSRSKLSGDAKGEMIYERIVFALAAHYGMLNIKRAAGDVGGGGAIASKSVGSVSVSYSRSSSNSVGEDYYNQTIYGQEYLQLLYRYCTGFMTIC